MEKRKQVILGIDPGTESSGTVLLEDGILVKGQNLSNEDLFALIDKYCFFETGSSLIVVYEDIRPFTSRFNMATINTIKIIGRLEYILKQQRVPFKAITRNEVKSFVFNKYNDTVGPDVAKKIAYGVDSGRMNKRKNGDSPKPSFIYVDDRIVYRAMMRHWNIDKPKPGRNNVYGIKTHSWQALGVVTCYLNMLQVGEDYFNKNGHP